MELVSARIPGVFDRATLARVIVDEILPTLLIRRSALYLFAGDEVEALYEQDLPPAEAAPEASALRPLLLGAGRCLPPAEPAPRFGWVRLVLPLAVQGEAIGVWLIGRRDPDDHFSASDIQLLSTVGNQLAPVAENIRLFERAQQEIEQRKAAEEEIRRSEKRFRTLFAATVEGIAIVRGGVILEVNQALPSILGYEAPELIGRRLAELLPDAAAEPGAAARETSGVRRDGTLIDLEVEAASLHFQGEDVTVVAVRDIARRKRDEADKKRLEQQLLHAEKMEAIGRLSAGVAHDFNNCLVVILGYADLLLMEREDDAPLTSSLTAIQEAGLRASALTRELLAFARRQAMEPEVVDFNQVVSGVEKMLRRLIGGDVELVTELDPALGLVLIDPGRMEHVLVNLAVNARHAMPKGGRLTVRTAAIDVRPGAPAPHADVPAGRWVQVTVADTGVGMDAETRARIFEPFFSTRKEGGGTGLGLATAYGFVAQSGGRIFVDSAPGKGARFQYLPTGGGAGSGRRRRRGDRRLGRQRDRTGGRGRSGRPRRDGAAPARPRLPGAGSGLGREALALAERHDGPLDLLVTDVNMPGMGGPELASRLLALRRNAGALRVRPPGRALAGRRRRPVPAEALLDQGPRPRRAQRARGPRRLKLRAPAGVPSGRTRRAVPCAICCKTFRFAVRVLQQRPLLSAAAILSLALGIGANATIFSVVNGLLFSSVGVREPERLVSLYTRDERNPGYPPLSTSTGRTTASRARPSTRSWATTGRG